MCAVHADAEQSHAGWPSRHKHACISCSRSEHGSAAATEQLHAWHHSAGWGLGAQSKHQQACSRLGRLHKTTLTSRVFSSYAGRIRACRHLE